MKKASRIFKFLILFVAVTLVIIVLSRGEIKINSYNAVVTINESGDMTVLEQWDMFYYEEMSVRFRDIGFDKYPADYPLSISINNRASFFEGIQDTKSW